MSSLRQGITVRFPSGYFGRDSRESPEIKPEFSRLFGALMATGARTGMPDAEVDRALEWIEYNPPSSVTIPECVPYVDGRGFDHVRTHFMHSGRLSGKANTLSGSEASYMFGSIPTGSVAWSWDDGVPGYVADTLSELCAELPYLGTAESLCVASFGDTPESTHTRNFEGFVNGTVQEELPLPGRAAELRRRWRGIVPPKVIGRSKNMTKAVKEVRDATRDLRQNLVSLPYAPVNPVPPLDGAPWDRGMWLPFRENDDPRPVDHVKIAETIHRALVRLSDDMSGYCPAALSGKFQGKDRGGVINNVAVVVVPQRVGIRHAGGNRAGILVLVPHGVSRSDGDVVLEAAQEYRDHEKSNITALGLRVDIENTREIDPSRWWESSSMESVRTWHPYPLAISDFPQESPFAAARKAIKFITGKAVPRSAVIRARRADPSLLSSYTHRTEKVNGRDSYGGKYSAQRVHPAFDATYCLEGIIPDTAVTAVGQSRHFGVGLLVPVDSPNTSGNTL